MLRQLLFVQLRLRPVCVRHQGPRLAHRETTAHFTEFLMLHATLVTHVRPYTLAHEGVPRVPRCCALAP